MLQQPSHHVDCSIEAIQPGRLGPPRNASHGVSDVAHASTRRRSVPVRNTGWCPSLSLNDRRGHEPGVRNGRVVRLLWIETTCLSAESRKHFGRCSRPTVESPSIEPAIQRSRGQQCASLVRLAPSQPMHADNCVGAMQAVANAAQMIEHSTGPLMNPVNAFGVRHTVRS